MGARRSALEWGSLLWALGKIEWSAGRTALGWSFLWVVGAWHSEEVVWLILGFHSCVLLLRVFSYRWESVTVKVLSLIRKQSIGHCLFWLISNYKAPHFDIFFSDFLGAVCLLNFFRRSALEFSAFGFITTRKNNKSEKILLTEGIEVGI